MAKASPGLRQKRLDMPGIFRQKPQDTGTNWKAGSRCRGHETWAGLEMLPGEGASETTCPHSAGSGRGKWVTGVEGMGRQPSGPLQAFSPPVGASRQAAGRLRQLAGLGCQREGAAGGLRLEWPGSPRTDTEAVQRLSAAVLNAWTWPGTGREDAHSAHLPATGPQPAEVTC